MAKRSSVGMPDPIFLEPLGDRVQITDQRGVDHGTAKLATVDALVRVMEKHLMQPIRSSDPTEYPSEGHLIEAAIAALIIITNQAALLDVQTGLSEREAAANRYSTLKHLLRLAEANA